MQEPSTLKLERWCRLPRSRAIEHFSQATLQVLNSATAQLWSFHILFHLSSRLKISVWFNKLLKPILILSCSNATDQRLHVCKWGRFTPLMGVKLFDFKGRKHNRTKLLWETRWTVWGKDTCIISVIFLCPHKDHNSNKALSFCALAWQL